ncbi:hypothetical protein ACFQAT_27570 [Undibacterium arcticum]|uniref:hypothetical protein n=1 Tax=Undibacterium arcticum TaxID=1762892 RepID=UPI0036090C14
MSASQATKTPVTNANHCGLDNEKPSHHFQNSHGAMATAERDAYLDYFLAH